MCELFGFCSNRSTDLTNSLAALDLPLTAEIGKALLLGILTDTLGFRTSNMTPDALRTAADLMELGIDLPALYKRALVERSFNALQYWACGLSRVRQEGGLVWTALTLNDRQAINYPGRDDADLVNVLAAVRDSDIALIFELFFAF